MENQELEIVKKELEILVECLPKKYCYQYGLDPKTVSTSNINTIDSCANKLFEPTPTTLKIYNIFATPWYPKPKEEQEKAAIEYAKKYTPNKKISKKLDYLEYKAEEEIQYAELELEQKMRDKPIEPIKMSNLKFTLMPWLKIKYNREYSKWENDLKIWQSELDSIEKKLKQIKKRLKYSKLKNETEKQGKAEWYRLNDLAEKELPIIEEKLQTITHLPKKYRTYYHATRLFDIVDCQRADTPKEAYNMLEKEINEENFRKRMEDIEESKQEALEDAEIKRNRMLEKEIEERKVELERHHKEMESQARAQTQALEEQAEAALRQQSTKKNYDSTRCLGCMFRNYCDRTKCNFRPGAPV